MVITRDWSMGGMGSYFLMGRKVSILQDDKSSWKLVAQQYE
jgi:hypothetical protein